MSRSISFLIAIASIMLAGGEAGAATYRIERLTTDLHIPVDAAVVSGFQDKIFVAQLGGFGSDGADGDPITKAEGRIVIYDRNTGQVDYNNPFLVIGDTSLVDPYGVPEVGLFSMAFHPDFASNGRFFVNAAVNHNGPAPTVDTRVSPFKTVVREYTVDVGNPALPITGSRTILELAQPAANHNGSWIGFNPLETAGGDNYLYITQGDGGNQHDPAGYGQDPSSWFGTVMRIDIDGDDFGVDPNRNYAIPADNPFVGGGGAPEVWAYGLRNPWRASFDPDNGDLYIGDVGQGWYEEIDVVPGGSGGGQNFGWRLREGFQATPTGGVGGPAPPDNADPIYDYLHIGRPGADPDFAGNSVTGGVVYRGPVQELYGRYIFADNVSGHIWSLDPTALNPASTIQLMDDLFTPTEGQIFAVTSFDLDENGNLLIVDGAGQLFQLVANFDFTLTVDRETGAMTFGNFTGDPLTIKSYELTSASGALEPMELTPIAGNYDAPPGGSGLVDMADDWQVLSAAGDQFTLSEESTGLGATLANEFMFTLSDGDGWIPSNVEDLLLTVTLGDGTELSGSVVFIGNDDTPFGRSDLTFDGDLTLADWVIFNANHLTDLSGLTPAEAYGLGDLDRDGDNDFDDFRLFQADYNAANGPGALAAALGVPEPGAGVLLLVGFIAPLLPTRSLRKRA